MEVILLKDIPNLGYQYDIIKTANGYANNYLIPRGLAEVANTANKKRVKENIRQVGHRLAKERQEALQLAEKLKEASLVLSVETSKDGKIFGAVTPNQLVKHLEAIGIKVSAKQIKPFSTIKVIGFYEAEITLHREVQVLVKFEVRPTEN